MARYEFRFSAAACAVCPAMVADIAGTAIYRPVIRSGGRAPGDPVHGRRHAEYAAWIQRRRSP